MYRETDLKQSDMVGHSPQGAVQREIAGSPAIALNRRRISERPPVSPEKTERMAASPPGFYAACRHV